MRLSRTSLALGAGGIVALGFFLYATLPSSSIHSLTALESAKLAGEYMVRHTDEEGKFTYELNPITGKESSGYNILRHAGTSYSLIELYAVTHNADVLDAAKRSLGFLTRQMAPCPDAPQFECVIEDNEIKLGGNGLAILAMAEYQEVTGNTDFEASAESLAGWILSTQSKEGEFLKHKIEADSGAVDAFKSDYYPGEALYALAKLSKVTGERKWVEAAHNGAQWIIEVRDRDETVESIEHDHWFLYALNELHADQPNDEYVIHARKITDAIAAKQHWGLTGDQVDWNGGYYDPPRSTPTATRSEGLAAAIAIFTRAEDAGYRQKALTALERGIAFELRTQMTDEKLKALNARPEALGGFHESLTEYAIRNDYVQHNISALLAYDALTKN